MEEKNQSNLPVKRCSGPKGIPIEQLIDLRQKGLTVTEISKIVGCTDGNVARRLVKVADSIDNTHKYRKHRGFIYAWMQNRILQEVSPTDIKKAKLIDKVKAISFLHNQERLEEGKSTQNITYADMIKARKQVQDEIEALEAEFGKIEEK